jgi:hypothetical protein
MQRPRNETAPRQYRCTKSREDSADTNEDCSIREIGFLHKGSTSCVWDLDVWDTDAG